MAKKSTAIKAQAKETVSAPAVDTGAPPVPSPAPVVTPPWANQPAATPFAAPPAVSPPDPRKDILSRIDVETASAGYGHIAAHEAYLVSEGFVEVNEDASFRDAAGNAAAIVTDKGKALLANVPSAPAWGTRPAAPPVPVQPPIGSHMPAPPPPVAPRAPAEKRVFAIDDNIPIPEPKRGGGGLIPRTEIYPFSKLEVGQSFHIPATADNPNPGKAIGGTVNAANLRYSEEVPGQTRVNRKGNVVPQTMALRHFAARTVGPNDHDPRGPGVRVFRLK